MFSRLTIKFAVLLLLVAAVALSASILLRTFIINDFKNFREGEMEDRVYWITADIEGTFDKYHGWNAPAMAEDAVWALILGMETRVFNAQGKLVMDSSMALDSLPALSKSRVQTVSGIGQGKKTGDYVPYPLFLAGKEIGRLDVRFLPFGKEELFIRRTNRFLLISSLLTGGLALVLSIIFARKLTGPILKLASAAEAVSRGDMKTRVDVSGKDEIARLSRSFNRMAHALEIQESLRKQLTANAAHELRTPLAAMRGELEGMLDGLIPTTREQLQSLHDETGKLTGIIAGMEELIQAEASVLSLKKEEIRLKPFLEAIVERYAAMFRSSGVEIMLQCEEEAAVIADPDRLSQVLVNLLGNALKATTAGGSVTVRARAQDRDVLVSVEDTGCGIAADELPFIFERFYRGARGGMGLGLAIVKELVEAHGGRIEVRSEPGKGSVFTVILPKTGERSQSFIISS
jgi:two-component system sensor histidine kinase BaeS